MYEETPVKANAGYAMVMKWHLLVIRQDNGCRGIVDVNGQQTFMKLAANIRGDSSEIAVIYDSLMEGSGGQLLPGDTMFTLEKTSTGLTTHWHAMEPLLIEAPLTCAIVL